MSKINETNYPRRTQASYADTDMLVIQAAGGNTYTTRLEDMREDYKETLAPILSALQDDVNENLATIEGSTASKAYAKGDFLVFGGRLCKAKTSIASGATLVLDTNIELDSVGDELSSISSHLSNLTTIKEYTVPIVENSVVAAEYGNIYKGTADIDDLSSDVALYGKPIAISVSGYGGIPVPCAVRYVTAQGKWKAFSIHTRTSGNASYFAITFSKQCTKL